MEIAISSLGLRVDQRCLSQKPDIVELLAFSVEVGKNDPSMDKSVILINLQICSRRSQSTCCVLAEHEAWLK